MSNFEQLIKQLISENDVVIFSKTYCPYCTRAKNVLGEVLRAQNLQQLKLHILELDVETNGSKIQAALQTLTGQRTVPNIFIYGKHIGGCDDLLVKQNSGELERILLKQ